MNKALVTTRVFIDEDTRVTHTTALIMPYVQMNGPFEDVSYLWEDFEHVTAFQDEFGATYHVLEPLMKVYDNWLACIEAEATKGITFSAQ